jgi:hypothetical protein
MHIDGMQCIEVVEGFKIELVKDDNLHNHTNIILEKFRELAPKNENEQKS